jgi:biopolymer transport protein ExbD
MAMNLGPASEDGVIIEINTTPLIDVMLVLLIMLIITIPIQTHAVKLNMPVSATTPPPQPPTIVRIDVAADGAVSWNGEALPDHAALEAHLAQVAAMPDQAELHLQPDRAVAYKHVAAVLAAAQRLGANKIGLAGNERFMQ